MNPWLRGAIPSTMSMEQALQLIPRVVLIANSGWNVYNFRMNLIESLTLQGFSVAVLAPEDEYSPLIRQSGLCELIRLNHLKSTGTNPAQDLMLLRELQHILKREKPDAIFTFTLKPNIFGSLVAKRLNIPVIPTVTGLGYSFLRKNWLNWVVQQMYSRAFRGLDKVFFHNQSDYELLKKLRILQHGQGIVVGGSGVDTNYFQVSAVPHQKPFVFLFLGRLLYDKGLAEFALAAEQIQRNTPNVEFWVAGSYQPEHPAAIPTEEFQPWVNRGVIQYFGQVEDVRPLISKAQVVVLPSYREGMPRAILEAMSMGRPVIATDVPGCRDAVQHGWNGWLSKPRSVEHLEQCLRHAMRQNQETLQEMGNNGRERALDFFDLHLVQQQYLNRLQAIHSFYAKASAVGKRTPVL